MRDRSSGKFFFLLVIATLLYRWNLCGMYLVWFNPDFLWTTPTTSWMRDTPYSALLPRKNTIRRTSRRNNLINLVSLFIFRVLATFFSQYQLFPSNKIVSAFWRVFASFSIFTVELKVCLLSAYWRVFAYFQFFTVESKVSLFSAFWRVFL